MKSVHQPVFEFVHIPKLEEWNQDAVVRWKRRWDQYVDTMRQRCVESGDRPEVATKPVKSAIERTPLQVLCLYELHKTVGDVTSEDLIALIDSKLVDLREDDIDARVLKYYRDFSALIEENGLGKILGVVRMSRGEARRLHVVWHN
ncbi:uncharacterized protein PITG_04172 [Phytophthora infestans T30-4]|uniref:Uncharacterized protein n=1 Tax=Phytophthora infestans (strain T30-4) TaxID=403677 RepID=D0N0Q2_PHYIT|nr:uncharacterized protein PITG_04172 [Phytophthora infestans T30-4]EEY67215.1 conserved hypothetical protein [Phytophthora infestans T30-4]|eukprot:XP_002905863.1 conserved hypothetical protein [Phytophthora infestans T30-4]